MWQSSSLVNALLKQCFAQSVTLCECVSTLASVWTVVHLGSQAFLCLTRVLHTGKSSTGSLRVHDVKQEVAETFHAIYQCREYVLSHHSGMHRKVPTMPHHVSDT